MGAAPFVSPTMRAGRSCAGGHDREVTRANTSPALVLLPEATNPLHWLAELIPSLPEHDGRPYRHADGDEKIDDAERHTDLEGLVLTDVP